MELQVALQTTDVLLAQSQVVDEVSRRRPTRRMHQRHFVLAEPLHGEYVVPEREHLFPKTGELVGSSVSHFWIPVPKFTLLTQFLDGYVKTGCEKSAPAIETTLP